MLRDVMQCSVYVCRGVLSHTVSVEPKLMSHFQVRDPLKRSVGFDHRSTAKPENRQSRNIEV